MNSRQRSLGPAVKPIFRTGPRISHLRQPEKVLSEICHFLGVDYDARMLCYPDKETYSRPDATLAHQWRRRLPSRAVRRAESVQADMLVARGYELSGLPRLEIGRLEAALLQIHCRLSRMAKRLRRQGLGLFLAGFVARRVPLWSIRIYEDYVRLEGIEVDGSGLSNGIMYLNHTILWAAVGLGLFLAGFVARRVPLWSFLRNRIDNWQFENAKLYIK